MRRRGRSPRGPRVEIEDVLALAAVVLLPFAFGGVEIWAFRSAALLLVGGAGVAFLKRGPDGLGLDRRARWLLPALLLGVWAGIQLVPLPPAVIAGLSPAADALYRDTFPGYPGPAPADLVGAIEAQALERLPEAEATPTPSREVRELDRRLSGDWSGWRTLSLLPSAGIERLFWYAALLAGFLLVRRRCFDPRVATIYSRTLLGFFLAMATFGLVYAATSNGKLYWVRTTLEASRPFGPYVNPNNFAAVMELGAPWMAGCALALWRQSRGAPWFERRGPIFAVGAILSVAAIVATASKSGPFLVAVCLVVLALAAIRGLRARLAVLASSAAGLAAAAWALRDAAIGERIRDYVGLIGGDPMNAGRLVGWRSMLDMVGDYRIAGTGFGSFRDVVQHYTPAGDHLRWVQAHNDYLEVLIEGGAIAGLLVLWLLWGFWSRALRRDLLADGEGWNLEALGLVLGMAALSVHAAFDFNHQIPGTALLFVALGAIIAGGADGRAAGDPS